MVTAEKETRTRTRAPIIDPGELTPEIIANPKALKDYAIAKERFERHQQGPEMRRQETEAAAESVRYAVENALRAIVEHGSHPVKTMTVRLDKNGAVHVAPFALRYKTMQKRGPMSAEAKASRAKAAKKHKRSAKAA